MHYFLLQWMLQLLQIVKNFSRIACLNSLIIFFFNNNAFSIDFLHREWVSKATTTLAFKFGYRRKFLAIFGYESYGGLAMRARLEVGNSVLDFFFFELAHLIDFLPL